MHQAILTLPCYKTPTIPLSEVCERYFSLSYEEALKKAARNELPVPTFRLTSSRKSPLMLSAETLGQWIDATEAAARAQWERSQV